jgi:hypothetical protein
MRPDQAAGRAVPHLLCNADANERSAGQGNLEDMFKQNAEQKQNAMQKFIVNGVSAGRAHKGARIMKVTTSASCGALCGYADGRGDYRQLDCDAPRAAAAAAGGDQPYSRHCGR